MIIINPAESVLLWSKFEVSCLQALGDFVFGQHPQQPSMAGSRPSAQQAAAAAVARPSAQHPPAAASLFAGGPNSRRTGLPVLESTVLPAGQVPLSPYTPVAAAPYQTPTFGKPPAAPAFGFARLQQQGAGEPFVFRGAPHAGELPAYVAGLGEETPAGTTARKRGQRSKVVKQTAQKKGKSTPATGSARRLRLSARKARLSTTAKMLLEQAAEEDVSDRFAAATSLVPRRALSKTPGEQINLQIYRQIHTPTWCDTPCFGNVGSSRSACHGICNSMAAECDVACRKQEERFSS